MAPKYFSVFLLFYIIIGVITFGHSAANSRAEDHMFSSKEERQAIGGVVSAVMWPLYWSWVAFE